MLKKFSGLTAKKLITDAHLRQQEINKAQPQAVEQLKEEKLHRRAAPSAR